LSNDIYSTKFDLENRIGGENLDYQKKLEQLSKNVGFPIEEILKEFQKNIEVYKDEEKAWKYTKMFFARLKPRGKMKWYQGFILAVREPIDVLESRRQKYTRIWQNATKSERLELSKAGLVAPDGTVLDNRAMIFGKPNPNFGKPLVGSDWRRHIYALVSENNFQTVVFARLTFQGDEAKQECPYKFFKAYKFLASRVEKTRFKKPMPFEVFNLRKSSMNPIELNCRIGLKDFVGQFIPAYQLEKGGYSWVYGDIDNIRYTSGFSVFADLVTEEPEAGKIVTLVVPSYYPILFKEGERVLSFGSIREYGEGFKQYTLCYFPLDNTEIMNM
jgi:hypothetical protein